MQAHFLGKYNTATSFYVQLFEADGSDTLTADPTVGTADVIVYKDVTLQTGESISWVGDGFIRVTLSATQMSAGTVSVLIRDAAGGPDWFPTGFIVSTYGNASAAMEFDLDTATQDVNVASLDASAITATSIATDAITAAKIAANAIGNAELAANAIDNTVIAADAIGASQIAANAIGSSELAANCITSSQLASNAIGNSQFATSAISAGTIATSAITSTKIAAGTLDYSKFSDPYKALLYNGGAGEGIHIDSTSGAAGTTFGLNGTADNPVDTYADALTLAASLGVDRFYIEHGTTITLTGDSTDYEFIGEGEFTRNIVNLGSQECLGAKFINLHIQGTQGGTGRAHFDDCNIDGLSGAHIDAHRCGLTGTIAVTSDDDHILDACYAFETGGGAPEITLTANSDVAMTHYSGYIQFNSGANTNMCTVHGHGKVIIDATCNNFTLNIHGAFEETDNGTLTTINNDASFSRTGGIPVAPVGEIQGIVGATSLTPNTCSTNLVGQGFVTDDIFKNRVIEWLTGNLLGAVSFVHAYDGTTGVLTFSATPNDITPSNTDTFRIL